MGIVIFRRLSRKVQVEFKVQGLGIGVWGFGCKVKPLSLGSGQRV